MKTTVTDANSFGAEIEIEAQEGYHMEEAREEYQRHLALEDASGGDYLSGETFESILVGGVPYRTPDDVLGAHSMRGMAEKLREQTPVVGHIGHSPDFKSDFQAEHEKFLEKHGFSVPKASSTPDAKPDAGLREARIQGQHQLNQLQMIIESARHDPLTERDYGRAMDLLHAASMVLTELTK